MSDEVGSISSLTKIAVVLFPSPEAPDISSIGAVPVLTVAATIQASISMVSSALSVVMNLLKFFINFLTSVPDEDSHLSGSIFGGSSILHSITCLLVVQITGASLLSIKDTSPLLTTQVVITPSFVLPQLK